MRLPFDGDYPVSSPFGPRAGGFHPGIDYGCPVGTPMIAIADGAVIFAADEGANSGGNHLAVLFDQPPDAGATKYGYMHLSRFDVGVGDHVSVGQQVGLSGGAAGAPGAGNSTGPHLHFWIGTNANTGAVDPAPYLSTQEDDMTEDEVRDIIDRHLTEDTPYGTRIGVWIEHYLHTPLEGFGFTRFQSWLLEAKDAIKKIAQG